MHPDYDRKRSGLSLRRFHQAYGTWVRYCMDARQRMYPEEAPRAYSPTCPEAKLCFVLSTLCRRIMVTVASSRRGTKDAFLHGYAAVFNGNVRPEHERYGWAAPQQHIIHLLTPLATVNATSRTGPGRLLVSVPDWPSPLHSLSLIACACRAPVPTVSLYLPRSDEFVFADISMLDKVVLPACRMALVLHQDSFIDPGGYDDPDDL